jgi:hypothetical protein
LFENELIAEEIERSWYQELGRDACRQRKRLQNEKDQDQWNNSCTKVILIGIAFFIFFVFLVVLLTEFILQSFTHVSGHILPKTFSGLLSRNICRGFLTSKPYKIIDFT